LRKMKKIALLGSFPPSLGGITTSLQSVLSSDLSKKYRYLSFHTYSRKHGSADYADETVIRKMFRIGLDFVRFGFFLVNRDPDLVHINSSFGAWSFWRDSVYLVFSRFAGKPVLMHFHGGNLREFAGRYRGFLAPAAIRRILRLPTRIAVLSERQCRPFQDLHPHPPVVRILPNMINLQKAYGFRGTDSGRGIPRRNQTVVFAASHLYREKGAMELLEAAKSITPGHPDLRFEIVGTGGIAAEMKDFCIRHRLRGRIRFLGALSQEETFQRMLRADIFVLPSYSEGFPMVVLEAMAAGLPVVATDVGALPEMVVDGVNGFLIEPRNARVLGEKIAYLLQRPEIRRRMSAMNRSRILRLYDTRKAAVHLDSVYRELFNEGPRKNRLDSIG
jgi:glycosyltransferase involved in cell wall biosynthesis